MGDKTYMLPPIGGKSILRSTGEEVEIIDFEAKERGDRTAQKVKSILRNILIFSWTLSL